MNNNRSRILLLVEGERLEKDVFSIIAKLYNLKYEIFCLRCNIFMLYNMMESYDFNASVKDILIEKMIDSISDEDLEILKNNKFAYTYIVMDFDIQHYLNDLLKALNQIDKMCEYFSDETDDTVGKLYVNYPMMESFRDRDSFIDEKFNDKIVYIKDFNKYKKIAGSSKLSSLHLNQYGKSGFNSIIKSNIDKTVKRLFNKNTISYDEYLLDFTTHNIYIKVRECVKNGFVYVLNTSMYFLVDYFGKKFFDELFNIKETSII